MWYFCIIIKTIREGVKNMADLQVKKSDGNLEPWSYDKLLASFNKAGLPNEDSERLAMQVESWAKENNEEGVVSSVDIRDKVIEVLSNDFPAEADTYQAFKK